MSNCEAVKKFLSSNNAVWNSLSVVSVAKYLCFMMSPHAGRKQWDAALKKFKTRVGEINKASLPLAVAKAQYISRAIPVLEYISQLAPPPEGFIVLSMSSATTILRSPWKSLDYNLAQSLGSLGGVGMTQVYK